MTIAVIRLFFLKTARVRQKNFQKVSSRFGCEDGSLKSQLQEPWQPASVINVSVGNNDCVDVVGIECRVLPVSLTEFLETLEQSAIDENSPPVALKQILRTRNCPHAAVECDTRHGEDSKSEIVN